MTSEDSRPKQKYKLSSRYNSLTNSIVGWQNKLLDMIKSIQCALIEHAEHVLNKLQASLKSGLFKDRLLTSMSLKTAITQENLASAYPTQSIYLLKIDHMISCAP